MLLAGRHKREENKCTRFGAPAMDFLYFGYGSNMDARSLLAKGVQPLASCPAQLAGWRLRFNVRHFFAHEGGVGNIVPGAAADRVCGVLHRCPRDSLALLDIAEAYPQGYDRIELDVLTADGPRRALAYVGTPAFVDETCLPTRRYLNILLQGAQAAGLDADYVQRLAAQPVLARTPAPRFVHPPGEWPLIDAAALAGQPTWTALDDAVFDMADARWQHRLLWPHYGGRDMTLHHLRRLDGASGIEDLDVLDAPSPAQRQYLDDYLHGYAAEYRYVGRFRRERSSPV